MSRTKIIVGAAALLILGAWELSRQLDLVSAIILASPSEIAKAAWRSGRAYLGALAVTAPTVLVSVLVSWVIGIGFGLVAGLLPLVGMAFAPILSALFAIPAVIWYPMFVIWFGIGPESKVLFAFVSGFFPIALATIGGVNMIDRRFLDVARSFGASRRQILLRILVPLVLPAILSGLRIGTGLIVIAVIIAELLASTAGVGFAVSFHRAAFETPEVYLGILLVLVSVVLFNIGLGSVERRVGRWRMLQREADHA